MQVEQWLELRFACGTGCIIISVEQKNLHVCPEVDLVL